MKHINQNQNLISLFKQMFILVTAVFGIYSHSLAQNQTYQDCRTAFPVCAKKSYHFSGMSGVGNEKEKLPELRSKADGFQETNSFWLKWKAEKAGTLSFIITPHEEIDDLDFIVFKLDGKTCNSIREVRAMVAGENIGDPASTYINCSGTTGLTPYSEKEYDHAGCQSESNNFLKALDMAEGEEYVLLVNNFESGAGFSISFEGSAVLSQYEACKQLTEGFEITNLYPNPGKDFVHVEYLSLSDSPGECSIISNKGELLSISRTDIKPGQNTITIQTDNLRSGSYIIQVKQNDKIASRIFIKI